MKKIKVAIVGFGNRGQVYADYSLLAKDEVIISAIIDPNKTKLANAKAKYHLTDKQLFTNWNEFLKSKTKVDIVVNATMDQLHFKVAMDILKAKFNMLIEKPIVNNKNDLLKIRDLAKKNKCQVFVCHVLRYTPFYTTIKHLINNDEIGNIVSMEMNEHVCIPHYLTSYDRGKWSKTKECGSGMLLAKCCHDLDLVAWLNNKTTPTRVSSFGSRNLFVPSNKPKGATKFCYNCPHEKKCIYSALSLYYERDTMPFLVLDSFNKPYDQITKKEKYEYLKKSNFGLCAYDTGGDIVDRQNVIIEFKNGSIVNFAMIGGTTKADRYIHIVGSKGEIEGKIEENKIILRKYERGFIIKNKEIDVSKNIVNKVQYGGHSGGDFMIMHDLVRYLNKDRSSISITSIDDSINGHLLVYAAEESRLKKKIVNL